jgi:hypothetical protein
LRIAFFHRAGNSLVCKQTFIMNVSVGSIILIHSLSILMQIKSTPSAGEIMSFTARFTSKGVTYLT